MLLAHFTSFLLRPAMRGIQERISFPILQKVHDFPDSIVRIFTKSPSSRRKWLTTGAESR